MAAPKEQSKCKKAKKSTTELCTKHCSQFNMLTILKLTSNPMKQMPPLCGLKNWGFLKDITKDT